MLKIAGCTNYIANELLVLKSEEAHDQTYCNKVLRLDGITSNNITCTNCTIYIGDNTTFVNSTFKKCLFHNITFCDNAGKIIFSDHTNMYVVKNVKFDHCDFHKVGIDMVFTNSDLSTSSFNDVHFSFHKIYHANTKFPEVPQVCPKEGEFTAYKLLKIDLPQEMYDFYIYRYVLGTFTVPADAKRINSYGIKCRSDKATLVSIEPLYPDIPDISITYNKSKMLFEKIYGLSFEKLNYLPPVRAYSDIKYKIGEEVQIPNYDDDFLTECTHGIHFFMTKEDVYDFAYDVYVSQNYPVNNNKTEKYLDEFKFGQQMLWLKVYAFLIKEDHEKNIKEKNKVFYDEFLLGGK